MTEISRRQLLGSAILGATAGAIPAAAQAGLLLFYNKRLYCGLGFGKQWQKFDVQMEVSGYHHNVAYDFRSLRLALYVAGQGAAVFRDMRYEALEDSTKS